MIQFNTILGSYMGTRHEPDTMASNDQDNQNFDDWLNGENKDAFSELTRASATSVATGAYVSGGRPVFKYELSDAIAQLNSDQAVDVMNQLPETNSHILNLYI